MSRYSSIPAEIKVKACQKYLRGEFSLCQAARNFEVDPRTILEWVHLYQSEGTAGLLDHHKNRSYPVSLKIAAVQDYLSGQVSQGTICSKYHIRNRTQLQSWIRQYNNHEAFQSYSGGSRRMAKHRKTTQAERQEIVTYCLNHDFNYGETALKYDVAYQQVYQWVRKYKKMGDVGLEDRRGHRAGTMPSRTPEEKLRDELARLKRENHWLQMENAVLKKLEELERRDALDLQEGLRNTKPSKH